MGIAAGAAGAAATADVGGIGGIAAPTVEAERCDEASELWPSMLSAPSDSHAASDSEEHVPCSDGAFSRSPSIDERS